MAQDQRPAAVAEPPAGQERVTARGVLIGLAKFAVAGVILYVLARRGEVTLAQLEEALSHWTIAVAVVLLTALSYYGQAVRWVLLLRSRSIRLNHLEAFRYLMMGKFFNLAVPGYFSEDVVRGLYLIRSGGSASRSKVVFSLVVDRLAGIVSLLLICTAGLLMRPAVLADRRLAVMLGISLAGIAGTYGAVLFVRLRPQTPALVLRGAALLRLHVAVDKLYAEARFYSTRLRLQAVVLAISLFNQLLMIWGYALFGQTLNMASVRAADYLTFVPLGVLATMIPIAPVGLGVGHVAFLTLLKLAGSREGANLFSLYTAVVILLSLLGGPLYLVHRDKGRQA